MSAAPSLFVHIVSYNSSAYLLRCLKSLMQQRSYECGQNLIVRVTDNASRDKSVETVSKAGIPGLQTIVNDDNLGFCGGHNQGVRAFLDSGCQFLLILNPDIRLEPDCLAGMTEALAADPQAGLASARLMRCDEMLEPLSPPVFDSAGMIMTPSLRHFDRGSGEVDIGQYRERQYVFGATGACLLIKRECVEDLLVDEPEMHPALMRLYPQLAKDRDSRAQLFDEAFFAYREDADLSWRAALYGWKCLYEPTAVAYHKRVVVPERRGSLPAELNRLGVRNRFLLQLNNLTLSAGAASLLEGLVVRNLIVILGVLLLERTSLSAFMDVLALWSRAWSRRRHVLTKARSRGPAPHFIGRWFQKRPYTESLA